MSPHFSPRNWEDSALIAELTDAPAERIAAFWREVAEIGTPIALDGGQRTTFLFRSADAPAIHVRVNRVSDKQHMALGMMERIPGTDIWVRTLPTGALLRASYAFHLLDSPEVPPIAPPPHGVYPGLLDPWSRTTPLIDAGAGHGQSILAGPLAVPEPDWTNTPENSHELVRHPKKHWWLYLPEHAPQAHVVLFDAEKWFGRLGLADALTRAIARGALPPLTVTGVGFGSLTERLSALRANDDFLQEVFGGEISCWTLGEQVARGVNPAPGGAIVAGQSLGALTALYALCHHAGQIAAVSAQSPSMWFFPGETGGPGALAGLERHWITEVLLDAVEKHSLPPIRLETGLREHDSVVPMLRLGHELRARGVSVMLEALDGGHDYARWRGGLIAALSELIGVIRG